MQYPFLHNKGVKQHPFSSSQLTTNDYLLILQPHEDLYNKIMDIKKQFAEKYDNPMAAFLKPHLTLVKFMQYEMTEKHIIKKVQSIAESNASFKVDLNGFGNFPTHTIYLNVQTKNQIIRLVKELKQAQHFLKFDKEHKPHFITEPHISIARKLLPWQYEKGWLEYSNTPFSASFMVNNLILLKRKTEAKGYTVAATFSLLNKQVAVTTQASLFG